MEVLSNFSELGGVVVVVGMFLWYLIQRNGKSERALKEVTDSLTNVQKAQETHTKVLMRVAQNHNLPSEADDLMMA